MFTAEILEIDLRIPLTDAEVSHIKTRLYDSLVLVFRDQRLTDLEFLAFAGRFGDTTPSDFRKQNVSAYRDDIPEILVLDKAYDPIGGTRHGKKRTEGWHSDPRVPGKRDEIGMLLAISADNDVAPTQWLDLRRAFASMPIRQRERLQGLTGVHRNTHSYVEEINEFHRPLVARHPVTGALSLDVHQNTLWDIAGMDQENGRKLIDDLFDQIAVPENIYTHEWRTNDLVMWDNLSLVHRRLGPITGGRTLHRIYAHEPESAEATLTRRRQDLSN